MSIVYLRIGVTEVVGLAGVTEVVGLAGVTEVVGLAGVTEVLGSRVAEVVGLSGSHQLRMMCTDAVICDRGN